ncbi:MAG TPA: carbonic anhydrase [Candidatus Saccharimonadales bacterium]|nr:carbonic anhydrase [Candidatus Saccharimonadales bacterium]
MARLTPGEKPKEIENIVITCMDHRYQEFIRQILMDKHGLDIDHVDRLAIGGSSTGVTDGSLMPSIQIAYEKHGAKNVYMLDHLDCGGFGGLEAFDGSEEREAQAHFESLDRATEAIHKVLPELLVVTYVVGMDGEPVDR